MKNKKKKALLGDDLPKPFQQSNALATSAQQQSQMEMMSNYNTIPENQQYFLQDSLLNPLAPKKKKSNIGNYLNPSLAFIDALIPGDDVTRHNFVQPKEQYNPNPYGTGSQAIAKNGKTLKAQKKALLGDILNPPTKSSFKYTHNNDTDFSGLTDALGYSLAKGVNPLQDNVGMQMMNSNNPLKKKLIDSVIAYNATNPNQGDAAINNYYNSQSQDPEIQAFKKQALSRYANDPYASYKKSPNVQINPTDQAPLLAKMPDGGQIKSPAPFTQPVSLNPIEDAQYQQWRNKLPKNLQYEGDYDLKALWKSNPKVKPSGNMHFPDTYKLPNHPTFSDESIYFNSTNQNNAGHWNENNYIPYNSKVKKAFTEMPDGEELPNHIVHGFKKKSTRTIYDKIQREDPNAYHALMKLGEEYGFSSLERGTARSHYNPLTNTTTVAPAVEGDDQVIIDELAHKIQFDKGALKSANKFVTNDLISYLSGGDPYTTKGTLEYQAHKEIAPKLRDKFYKAADYKNGGNIPQPLQVEDYDPLSEDTILIKGESHEDGGTNVKYGDTLIEAEKGETLSVNSNGNATIWGNLVVPGTKQKFKNVVKQIGEQEGKYDKLEDNGLDLINNHDPLNKMDKLKFNSGRAMTEGAKLAKDDLQMKKDNLSLVQKALLDGKQIKKAKNGAIIAENGYNEDPIPKKKKALTFLELSNLVSSKNKGDKKTAQNAYQQFYQSQPVVVSDDPTTNGKQSIAVRHNNPGNIKFGDFAKKFGGVKGDPGTDGGDFAHFPTVEAGMNALKSLIKSKNYKDLPVEQALKRWTGGTGYSVPLGELRGKKISDLNPDQFNKLINTITVGEDGKYYTPDKSVPSVGTPSAPSVTPPNNFIPTPKFNLPNTPLDYKPPVVNTPETVTPDPLGRIRIPERKPIASNATPLSINQILPELVAFGQNKEQPVSLQQYNPSLYSAYQVSFQDRLNDNNSTFRALTQQLSNSPTSLQALAANKYSADNAVQAEEFRTNQSISNDINNKNLQLLNDSELKNLGLADQQMQRQTQAKANTENQTNAILNSLSSKYQQNNLENKTLQTYENTYNYRFGDNQVAEYKGPNAIFTATGVSPSNETARTQQTFDALNNLTQTRVTTPSAQQIESERLKLQNLRTKTPRFAFQKLFK